MSSQYHFSIQGPRCDLRSLNFIRSDRSKSQRGIYYTRLWIILYVLDEMTSKTLK